MGFMVHRRVSNGRKSNCRRVFSGRRTMAVEPVAMGQSMVVNAGAADAVWAQRLSASILEKGWKAGGNRCKHEIEGAGHRSREL